MTRLSRFFRRFRRDQRGSATVEFVILFPVMMTFCLSTIELGMLLSRQVMLERGIDLAVRDVRIGAMVPVSHGALVASICESALIIPDCTNQLKLEMVRRDPRAFAAMRNDVDCVDRADPGQPPEEFNPGVQNELVVLRACALFDPFFPTTGLGGQLQRASGDAYALVATSSYVVEPQ